MLRSTLQLFFIFLFLLPLIGSLKFTEEKSGHSGLVFVKVADAKVSYDTYTIVYHIDLNYYYKILKMITQYTTDLKTKCNKLNSNTCNIVIESIETQIDYMKRDEIDINAYQQKQTETETDSNSHHIQKRAIEFIGSAFHWMFGLMDADTARAYDEKINELIKKASKLEFQHINQTVFIQETIGTINNSFHKVNIQMTQLNNKIDFYLSQLESWNMQLLRIEAETEMLKAETVMQNLISEHKTISRLLLKSLENAISGRINQLIPSFNLQRDLFAIHRILPMNQMLPINFTVENPLNIFKYSKTSASIFGKRFLLEITLPIIERQQYVAYEIIPIPTLINNKTIIINPSMQYVLINTGGSEYIPISKNELDNSNRNFYNEKIITPSEYSHLDFSQNCEITIFLAPRKNIILDICNIKIIPTMNYFVSINHNDIFFVTIAKPITIIEHCIGKPITAHDLSSNGKLTLESNCRISTDKISIRSRTNYKFISDGEIILSNRTQSLSLEAFAEKISFLQNITIPEFEKEIIIQDYSTDFQKLSSQAEKMIEDAKWISNIEEIHYDNVNRSYFIYWLIGIVVVVLIIAGIIFGIIIYLKFYNINTWIKLANVLGTNNSDRVPKLFIQNHPSAPSFNKL